MEPRSLILDVKEKFDVLNQIEKLLVLFYIFALMLRAGFWILNLWSCLLTEQQPHIDIKNYEKLANGHNCKLKRNSDGFHTDLFDLDKLAVSEFTSNRWIFIVIDHEVDQSVKSEAKLVLQLELVLVIFSVYLVKLLKQHVKNHVERLKTANCVHDFVSHSSSTSHSIIYKNRCYKLSLSFKDDCTYSELCVLPPSFREVAQVSYYPFIQLSFLLPQMY